jgi:hypothetical protein
VRPWRCPKVNQWWGWTGTWEELCVTVGAVCGGWSYGFGLVVGQLGIRGITKTIGGEECVQ